MKKRYWSIILLLTAGFTTATAQTNVGSTAAPDASAALQVTSTTQGFRPPQVSLSSTNTFGIAAFSTASAANGMLVYNTNAAITGTVAYPAYGKGLYKWDSTGWVAPSKTPVVFCAGNGTPSAAVANNTLTPPLNLGTAYILTADVTETGGDTVHFVTAGTYKIDVCVIGNLTSNNTSKTGAMQLDIVNSGTAPAVSATNSGLFSIAPVQAGSNTTVGANYLLQYSYIAAYAQNNYIVLKAIEYGMTITSTYQVLSLQITRVQ